MSDEQLLAQLPATVRALAAWAGVTRSTIAYRLGCLEAEGRVKRESESVLVEVSRDVWWSA